MTSPVTRYHVINGALQRYTRIPPAFPDPGDGSGGGLGHIELGGSATVSGTIKTIFGYNWNDKDNPEQTIAGRKAKFGNRNPCPRVYTGDSGHPTTFSFGVGADEKRLCWSFKAGDPNGPNASQTATYLASTAARDDRYIPWLQDIPANSEVFWDYHHEVNGGGALEVSQTNYLNTYTRMKEAKAAATLQPGVKVHITANFMAYQVRAAGWTDDWVPLDAEILTWDMYGNPGQNTPSSGTNKYGTATGIGYNSQYPLIAARTAAMFAVTEATGFAASWGILEVNSPLRNWDLNEVGRKAWTQDCIDYFMAGGGMVGGKPPKICLLWEAPSGANWNQAYGYNWHPEKTPQGTVAFNQTKITNSPLWDVWRPYIVGTPVGG